MNTKVKTFSGLPALQNYGEYSAFLEWVKSTAPTSYLEIGVARGDTFYDVVSAMPEGSHAVAVDFPSQRWGVGGSLEYLERVVLALREKGYKTDVHLGNSRDPKIISAVEVYGKFDLCFIDGDHSYEGVKADFDNYGKLAKKIAFHDIAVGHIEAIKHQVEVPKLWHELKPLYKHIEYVDDVEFPYGIGVLYDDNA